MARVLVLFAALLALTGCGSGSKQSSTTTPSTEQWASDVCTALGTWTDAFTSASSTVAQQPSRASLDSAASDVQQATQTLKTSLQALGKPDLPVATEAKTAIDDLATELSASVDTIQSAVKGASGAAGVLTAVSTVSSTLVTMGSDSKATLTKLESLQGQDDLKSAFSNADSCKQLDKSK